MADLLNKFKNTGFVLAIILLFAFGCAGKTKKQPESELSVFGFTVGKSNLNDVKSKLQGKGVLHEDHGTSVYLLCYESKNDFFITFESNEAGGSARLITSIYVSALKEPRHSKQHCGEVVKASQEPSLSPGLKLGISLEEAEKIKGSPAGKREDLLVYEDSFSNLELNFENNALSSFRISKVE